MKIKNIKVLDDYIKSYEKQRNAQAILDEAKQKAIDYMKENAPKLEYKNKLFVLCEKKTFTYSPLAIEMSEACSKQKKIEELNGDAEIKSTSNYIRMTTAS